MAEDFPAAPRLASARGLNPAAGDHPVTADAAELAAADRAIRRSWVEFPYYALRYGARGRAFSDSDSGWLVTLCDWPPATAAGQVEWLAGVLASRGMPRWLLECHLRFLAEELTAARPERAARYAVLAGCAEHLAEARRPHLPDAELEAADRRFAALAGGAADRRHRHTGAIIAAARADEQAGVAGALSSVLAWLRDPQRFGPEWIAAVDGMVDGG